MAGKRARKDDREASRITRTGSLYVVATPIGNLEDITHRALRILKEVDLIAAEDTRHTRKLLAHYGISGPLISYYREREVERGQEIVSRLLSGEDVALVSDAGTPALSDPGGILVDLARQHGISVVPVPGPSALTALLSVAGTAFIPFVFVGFLPARQHQRRKFLTSMASEPHALIFFESPQRYARSLQDCLEVLGDRQAVTAREITKRHEDIRQALLSDLLADLPLHTRIKGELVVAIKGASAREKIPELRDLAELLIWYRRETTYSLRDAVQQIAKDLGIPRTEVYQQALKIWKK